MEVGGDMDVWLKGEDGRAGLYEKARTEEERWDKIKEGGAGSNAA